MPSLCFALHTGSNSVAAVLIKLKTGSVLRQIHTWLGVVLKAVQTSAKNSHLLVPLTLQFLLTLTSEMHSKCMFVALINNTFPNVMG